VKNVNNAGMGHQVVGVGTEQRSCERRRDHPARARDVTGDRGPIGAMKRRNGRGAKGARKVET
jgi:hypothetical protein